MSPSIFKVFFGTNSIPEEITLYPFLIILSATSTVEDGLDVIRKALSNALKSSAPDSRASSKTLFSSQSSAEIVICPNFSNIHFLKDCHHILT